MPSFAWVQPGEPVRVRGERWRVLHVAPHGACAIVEVAGVDAGNGGRTARFLAPFEQIDRLPRHGSIPRIVRIAAWRARARAALAEATPSFASLRAAAGARVSLLSYQLEPAIAATRGLACRFLLADAVGLGKTIQAGLIVAELLARDRDARILVVTPAGLREQWRDELRMRFAIDAEIVDGASLAAASARLPHGVNPWSAIQVALTSIDFLKRPEVIRALEPLVWDLVAFDEAHALAGRSDRALAAELVARCARRVVTITATPHDGDDRAYERLCAIGRLDPREPLLVFRRSRSDAGMRSARTLRMLRIRPSRRELRLHRALDRYARLVAREGPVETAAAARLAMIVLARRACSSPASLARSIERRLSLLVEPPEQQGEQLRLPIDGGSLVDDDEPLDELAAPGLADAQTERASLERLLAMARAIGDECKLRALARLLRRCGEPAIVFTQYRDTLQHLALVLKDGRAGLHGPRDEEIALLHGGLTAHERAIEARRFTVGDARLLLATDAASEGLNLHHRCRVVVSLDVPWTPLRLEQRIGRVDRLGQQRRVHALLLVARATSDARTLSGLRSRGAQANERAPFGASGIPAAGGELTVSLRETAAVEARRLGEVRALARSPAIVRRPRPVMAVLHRRHRASLCLAFRLLFVDADGGPIWDTLVAPLMPAPAAPRGARAIRAWFDRAASSRRAELESALGAAHGRLLARLRGDLGPAAAMLIAREQALLDALRARSARMAADLAQPGLFDRRALRDADAQQRIAADAVRRAQERVNRLHAMRTPAAGERHLVFAVAL